jgi:sec-independent protein translocase protein TatC
MRQNHSFDTGQAEMKELQTKDQNSGEMPFYAHFVELRSRLLRIAIAIFVGTIVCFSFASTFYGFLAVPIYQALPEASKELIFLNPVEPFFVYLKISILAGFIVTSPYIFFQIWRFIAPGLYAHEKKAVIPLVASSTLIFLAGAVFCYCLILPYGLKALIGAGMTEEFAATAQISMAAYYDLVVRLIMAFGIVFEMPIFSLFLAKLGVITDKTLVKHWRVAVVLIFVAAAILTPPDVITQICLALPMCILYGVSIFVARISAPKVIEAVPETEPDGE